MTLLGIISQIKFDTNCPKFTWMALSALNSPQRGVGHPGGLLKILLGTVMLCWVPGVLRWVRPMEYASPGAVDEGVDIQTCACSVGSSPPFGLHGPLKAARIPDKSKKWFV
jgi:hypothetical protein